MVNKGSREQIDDAVLQVRRRRATVKRVLLILLGLSLFCCFISGLLGVPQSFLGQWWMKPPRYPGAELVDYREGEVCQLGSPGVYCYEWYYQTADSVEKVQAYYEDVRWPLHPSITFEWCRGQRFNENWVAERTLNLVGNVSAYQIILLPAFEDEGQTLVYILEQGAWTLVEK
ncbi:MAG: hypothetical protein U9Q70_08265 [Chloroflexota bacterium]|nr:hypothetical protein [Chloroflexota bacterium]